MIMKLHVFILFVVMAFLNGNLLGQSKIEKKAPPSPILHEEHEKPEGKYIKIKPEDQKYSPPYNRIFSNGFTITQVNVSGSGENIVGDAANEPSLAIDPTNPNRMAIGWRQFNTISSNFRQAGYGYTTDAGQTWTFPGIIEPGVFRSDPVLFADADGNFYFNSLTSSGGAYTCQVFKSEDGGSSWGPGMEARGGDKQWMIADITESIGRDNFYSFWTYAYSSCYPEFFIRGPMKGLFYENCIEIPGNPYWGTLDVDRNGVLFAAGSGPGNFIVAKSTTARDIYNPTIWDTSVSVDLDGYIVFGARPNPGGLAGQAWIAVDKTTGPTGGYIYLLCSVERKSTTDSLDVMFSRSTDGGITWNAPVRLNDDSSNSNWQWFGTMSVGPTGRIDVVWLDTRDNPGTVLSSLYYTCSTDGGVTWSPNQRLSESFNPHLGWPQQNKMGDYFHMISDSGGAYLAWAATFNGEEDVYFSWIPENPIIPNSISVAVNDRWNMVSVPVERISYLKQGIFPTSTSDAFLYENGGYIVTDTLINGKSYWLKFDQDQTIAIEGNIIDNLTVNVHEGWNMIGSVSSPIAVSSIISDPPGLITSNFFGYDQSYLVSDSILPGKGYWVNVEGIGTLFLSSNATRSIASRIKITPTDELPPSPPVINEKITSETPVNHKLYQNYPNPFNSSTVVKYQLPVTGWVTIKIYDLLGQEVDVLVNETKQSGEHTAIWNAGNIPNGVYYYRLTAGIFTETRKMILMK
mgnify:CR=1 FL=1